MTLKQWKAIFKKWVECTRGRRGLPRPLSLIRNLSPFSVRRMMERKSTARHVLGWSSADIKAAQDEDKTIVAW